MAWIHINCADEDSHGKLKPVSDCIIGDVVLNRHGDFEVKNVYPEFTTVICSKCGEVFDLDDIKNIAYWEGWL